MDGLTHDGWTLDIEVETSCSNQRRYYWARHEDGRVEALHVSSYLGNFDMTAAKFAWLIDNDFPQPNGLVGGWLNENIEEAMHAKAHA